MMKVLKNKKGITLVELMVGLLLLSIIVAAAGSTIAPMLKVYSKANEIAEWNTLLDNLANQMVSDLSEMTVPIEDQPGAGAGPWSDNITFTAGFRTITYAVSKDNPLWDDGMLERNGILVLPEDFYKRKIVSFILNDAGNHGEIAYMLTVRIEPSDGEGATISRDYAVRPLVLNQD
jgi:prepilin-type N-terminal cleavage/methylation domain-containing protein